MVSRFVAGAIPTALVGWEVAAYARRRETKETPVLTEGSLEWQVETEVAPLDLVFSRRSTWSLGPLTALAGRSVPDFDSVGVVVSDPRTHAPRVLEAHLDGSVSLVPFAAKLKDPDCVEISIRRLAWPDRSTQAVHLFATTALLQAAADPKRPRPPWRAAVDARFAPAWRPRAAWPAAHADAPLAEKLDQAVSPATTLVVELYCALGVMPSQHKATPYIPADFANADPPLRKGARLGPSIPIRASNAPIVS